MNFIMREDLQSGLKGVSRNVSRGNENCFYASIRKWTNLGALRKIFYIILMIALA
jgi:hypothetical protein